MISITPMWRRWRHTAFIGGLGLSGLAVLILLLSAYFAGTAPHLPNDVAALETLRTSRDWAPVSTRSLDTGGGSSSAEPSLSRISPEPNDLSRHQPIDVSDLPLPHRPYHATGD